MPLRLCRAVALLAPVLASAQTPCPSPNFLLGRQVNLKPTATSHIDVVRQPDGSYTGFEAADAAPYLTISVTPHFDRQFAACIPHTIPTSPSGPPPIANSSGAGSQAEVSMPLPSGNFFVASMSNSLTQVRFDIFDPQHHLLSENSVSYLVPDFPSGGSPDQFGSLLLTDLNGDGKLDLIAGFNNYLGPGKGGVWTFLGNGDGTFQSGVRQVLVTDLDSGMMSMGSMAAADLNGDGKPDLAFVAGGSVNIALGNGAGTFDTNTRTVFVQAPGAAAPIGSPTIADLNGDGKADLVVNNLGSGLALLPGNGDGTFGTATLFATLPNAAAAAIGDLNGDGNLDIATDGGTILFGDGKGGFPSRRDYAQANSGAVTIADFDGDGVPDLIFGAGNAKWFGGTTYSPWGGVLFGSGGGVFVGAPVSGVGSITPVAPLVFADFNADGFADAVVVNWNATPLELITLLGHGDGTFSSGSIATSGTGAPTGAVAADFNRDGKLDVAVLLSSPTTEVLIFPGKGDGSFGAPITQPLSDLHPSAIMTADLNNDGIADLVLLTDSTVYVWIGKGDGTFTATSSIPATYPGIAIADFNGDGKLDIALAASGSAMLSILLGRGDGTFPQVVSAALPSAALGYPGEIVAADFTGDGKIDVALVLASGSSYVITPPAQIAMLAGNGDGTFGTARLSSGGMQSMQVADINGDRIPDLVGFGPALVVRYGNGDGTFQAGAEIFAGDIYSFANFQIADLNQDGKPDVALSLNDGVGTLLNLTLPAAALTIVSAASFADGPLAPGSAGSAFGENLAPTIASGAPSPSLEGVTVTINDSAGITRTAPLFFVSSGLINFLVPPAAAPGPATLTVNGVPSGTPLSAKIDLQPIAPALFTMGSNIAAAYIVQVAPGGAQTILPVFTFASGAATAVPVNVSQPGETFLILFGSGFDAASAADIGVTVQGIAATATYSGPVSGNPGLDSINVLLPSSLAGTGVATVNVTVAGIASNAVLITIQ